MQNELVLLEVLAVFVVVLFGWLHMRQNDFQAQLDTKADKEDLDELKNDMKSIRDNVVELKVDQAKCLTILENLNKSS